MSNLIKPRFYLHTRLPGITLVSINKKDWELEDDDIMFINEKNEIICVFTPLLFGHWIKNCWLYNGIYGETGESSLEVLREENRLCIVKDDLKGLINFNKISQEHRLPVRTDGNIIRFSEYS